VEYNFAGTFRNNVAKYVIIITDDVPGGNDDSATTADITEMNRLKDQCIAKSVKVIVLGQGVEKTIGGKYIWKNWQMLQEVLGTQVIMLLLSNLLLKMVVEKVVNKSMKIL
jgi:hypothetical protein